MTLLISAKTGIGYDQAVPPRRYSAINRRMRAGETHGGDERVSSPGMMPTLSPARRTSENRPAGKPVAATARTTARRRRVRKTDARMGCDGHFTITGQPAARKSRGAVSPLGDGEEPGKITRAEPRPRPKPDEPASADPAWQRQPDSLGQGQIDAGVDPRGLRAPPGRFQTELSAGPTAISPSCDAASGRPGFELVRCFEQQIAERFDLVRDRFEQFAQSRPDACTVVLEGYRRRRPAAAAHTSAGLSFVKIRGRASLVAEVDARGYGAGESPGCAGQAGEKTFCRGGPLKFRSDRELIQGARWAES